MADDSIETKLARIREHNRRILAMSPEERAKLDSAERARGFLETKEKRAVLLKSEATFRAKLRRKLAREIDPDKRLAIEIEIRSHEVERIYTSSRPNKNRRRGYKSQANMLARQ